MSLDLHRGARTAQMTTRVFLVGEQWDDARPMLNALAGQEDMVLVGPAEYNLRDAANQKAPAVIMIGPGADYHSLLVTLEGRETVLPVLVCIAHEDLENDVLYDDADDFLLVPCSAAEMRKRLKRLALKSCPQALTSRLTVGKLVLDLETYQVTRDGNRVDLAWLEFQLLKFLMENPGRVYTREQLLAHVWGVEGFGGTRTVDVHIRRLRHKLEVGGEHYFRTVKNVGYGIVAPSALPSLPQELPTP